MRSDQRIFAGLVAAVAVVVLSFGTFLIGTADQGASTEQLPAPIVIIPEVTAPSSPTTDPPPVPAPAPAPIPIPAPPAPGGGQVPPPPVDDDDDDDDGGDDGGGGDDDG